MEDQKYLRNLFQLNHSYGYQHHVAGFEDGLNHRADCHIEIEDYNIHGSQKAADKAANAKNKKVLDGFFSNL